MLDSPENRKVSRRGERESKNEKRRRDKRKGNTGKRRT
jgi:hypothetical protein